MSWLLSLFGLSEQSIIWRFQRNLRLYEFHINKKHRILSLLYKAKTSRIGLKYGLLIPPNVFEAGMKIMHLGPITINSNSKVGKNCLIGVNVALVATSGLKDAPIIGDNCSIGTGAILIGGIKIGNNVAIGAGAVVVNSFESDCITIAGVPAKIISKKHIL